MTASPGTRALLVMAMGVLVVVPWVIALQSNVSYTPAPGHVPPRDVGPEVPSELERLLGVDPRGLLLYDRQGGSPVNLPGGRLRDDLRRLQR
jgi:hypothetical protein